MRPARGWLGQDIIGVTAGHGARGILHAAAITEEHQEVWGIHAAVA